MANNPDPTSARLLQKGPELIMTTHSQFVSLCLTVAMSAAVSSHAANDGNWATYHGDYALTGSSNAALPTDLLKQWTYKATSSISTTPVSDGKHIYFMSDTPDVISLTMQGKELWKRTIKGESFSAPLIVAGDLLVVGSNSGFLYGIETSTAAWSLT